MKQLKKRRRKKSNTEGREDASSVFDEEPLMRNPHPGQQQQSDQSQPDNEEYMKQLKKRSRKNVKADRREDAYFTLADFYPHNHSSVGQLQCYAE